MNQRLRLQSRLVYGYLLLILLGLLTWSNAGLATATDAATEASPAIAEQAIEQVIEQDLQDRPRALTTDQIPRVTLGEFIRTHPLLSATHLALILALIIMAWLFWLARVRLAETAGFLERLVASVPIGLYEADLDPSGAPRLVFLSARGLELIGQPGHANDLSEADFTRHMHADDVQRFIDSNRRAVAHRLGFDESLRFIIKGQPRWLQIASTPRARANGDPVWSGYLLDVTELWTTRSLFEAVFEQAPIAILLHDSKTGDVLDANPKAWQEYGFDSREAFLADQASTWLTAPPYTLEAAAARLRRAAEGEIVHFDWASRKVDATIIWHRVTLAPIRYAEQDSVLALCIDITQQRLSEQRLRESESRFRILLEHIPGVAVQSYGLDGKVHYWNETSERLYGFSKDEALGSNLLDLIIPPEMHSAVRQQLQCVANGGDLDDEELELISKDGRRIPVYSSHTTLRLPGSEPELFCLDIDLSERKRHEQALLSATNYDGLTGLPNRLLLSALMRQACARADRTGLPLALCYLDLDHFKPINDAHGEEIGDQVLIKVAKRLRRLVQGSDVVARIGGDDFVLLLDGIEDYTALEQRLQGLLDGVSRAMQINDRPLQINASIGVTLYPRDANEPETLLRHANQAMYEAKGFGRSRYRLFDPQLEDDLEQRRRQLLEIEHGLAKAEFVLHYQPKVDMANGRLIGLEALVRWQHPSRGLLPPLAFLETIDGSDLECQFDQYIIEQALKQLDDWNQAGFNWVVSVNIGGPHLLSDAFVEQVLQALQRYPSIRGEQLELEILESAAVSELDRATATLKRCRALGIRVALDDFGTGYSSLSRLRSLPVDVLKIDQSFVRGMLTDLSDYSIVKSVIGLAHAFNLEVIAEGVETSEHAVILLQLGCRQGQGYGFARPMPAAAVPEWFEQWQQSAPWQQFEQRRLSASESTLQVAVNTHHAWVKPRAKRPEHGEMGVDPRPG